ncbi:MAG TPA: cell division protein FtsZ [bacterium]|nr:cell division protein FtsZ [bacterium]
MVTKEQIMQSVQAAKESVIQPYHTIIRVLGTGGAGNNTIRHLFGLNAEGIQTIAVNTDAQDLLESKAERKILIGKNITGGLGAGGDPEIGERAAEESRDLIKTELDGTDLLFMTCGMGGGTGTGSAPVICGIAKEMGILTIAVVTLPFSEEGIVRWENAQVGLEKLRKKVHSLIVLNNDRLLDLYPDQPVGHAFHKGDEFLVNAVMSISDMVLKKGLVNLDFADVSAVMKDGPHAFIGLGESNSENRLEEAVNRAINHPMMKVDIRSAQSILVHISGGANLTLKETRNLIKYLSDSVDPNARIIWGVTVDKKLRETLRVMLVVSGLPQPDIPEKRAIQDSYLSADDESHDDMQINESILENGQTIFDIKESILSSGSETATRTGSKRPLTQTTLLFYQIFEEEAAGDLKKFDRAVHDLRENPENRRALLDAIQSCKLLHASSQMFGFDEIGHLLSSIIELLESCLNREMKVSKKVIDSITLAMEMVVDLIQNQSDGKGETGYVVDRLLEIKEESRHSI